MSLRVQILEAGRRMLLDEGFDSLSMRKIAREIDVSATSIYLHFKNKDHLIYSLIEEGIGELNRSIRRIADLDCEPLQKIEKIARSYIAFGLDRPQEYEVIFMVRPEEMPRYPKEKFRKARLGYEMLASVIREGNEKDYFLEPEPLTSAYAIWAQLHGVTSVILNKRLDTRVPKNDFITHAVNQITNGIQLNRSSAASYE